MSPSSTSSSERPKLVGADDVILVPEDVVGGRRTLALFVVALFLCVCVGTLVVDVIWPTPHPIAIGAEGEREAKLARNAKWYDGSLAAKVERDLRMTSRVRRTFGSPYALALYRGLGFAHGEVTGGKDGWLFYTSRSGTTLGDEFVRTQTELASAALTALDRRLAALGVRLLVMPIPRKEVIVASKLRVGVNARPWVEERLLRTLRSKHVRTTDLASAWAAVAEPTAVYHVTGSHWTMDGELWAAEAAARELGLWTPPEKRGTELKLSQNAKPEFDLLTMAGVDMQAAEEFTDTHRLNAYKVSRRRDGKSEDGGAEIAVVGTSFTAERVFSELLSYFCDAPVDRQSEPGGEPSVSFLKLVRRRADHLPHTIVFELPPHLIFVSPVFVGFDTAYGLLPSPPVERVLDVPIRADALASLARLTTTPISIGALPSGALTHDGAGLAQVRLRGKPGPNGVRIAVRTGSVNRNYLWPASVAELLVPILALDDEAPLLHIVASAPDGAGSLELESLEIATIGRVLAKDESSRVSTKTDDGWRAVLLETVSQPTGEHAKLALRIVQPSAEAGGITTTLSAVRGAELVWSRSLKLRAGASTALIDLDPVGPLEGLRFELASPEHRFVVQLVELVDGGGGDPR